LDQLWSMMVLITAKSKLINEKSATEYIVINISEFIVAINILSLEYINTSKAGSATVRNTATALQQENNRYEKMAEEESKEYADIAMQS
jgi:hypothetical protein